MNTDRRVACLCTVYGCPVTLDVADCDYEVNGERVRCSLELSIQRRPSRKQKPLFYLTCKPARGDAERLEPSWRTVQVAMYAKIGD